MDLVPIYSPQTESELAMILSLLEAHDIPHFVHNRGFGSLYPGLQIDLYNRRTIMVPAVCSQDAKELLSSFIEEVPSVKAPPTPRLVDKLRMIGEALLFGWFLPGTRRPRR